MPGSLSGNLTREAALVSVTQHANKLDGVLWCMYKAQQCPDTSNPRFRCCPVSWKYPHCHLLLLRFVVSIEEGGPTPLWYLPPAHCSN